MIPTVQVIGSKSYGGAERWFLRFSRALAELGYPTTSIVRRGSALESANWGPVPWLGVPLRTVWDPLSRRAVCRALRSLRPELIQTYMGRATRNTRIPRKGPVHLARLGGYYKLDGYRHAHAWVGNTRGICDYLTRSGFPAHRVFHIYNFQEPPLPAPAERVRALRQTLGLSADAHVLLTVGRLVPFKGHRYLIEALSRLPREMEGRPLRLVVVGDGPLRKDLRAQARALGVDDRVLWAGWRTDPNPFYQMADLVVFPSVEREPFGNVVLESWSHGRPLLTTRFRGALEYVRHGEDAWQVRCEDARDLARGIRRVLADPVLAGDLAEQGRGRVQRDFSRSRVMRQYVELYEFLLGAH